MTADPLPPPAPPPIGPRRLHRSTSDRMWQGVCGGIAEYLGVDPTVVRIGFVLLTITGGLGFVAYAAVWLLVPEDGQTAPTRRSPWQIAGAVLLVLLLSGWADVWDGGPAVPLALVVIGAVLVWGGRDDVPIGRSTDAPAARAGVVVEQRGAGRWRWAPSDVTAGAGPTEPLPPAPIRREPRHVGRAIAVATGGLLLALGAITGAVAASEDVSPTAFLGVTLAGFGVLMAVGSFWGWSRPLAFGAMAVVLALATASIIDVPLRGGVGDERLRPSTAAELPGTQRLAIGSLDIDLTAVDPEALDGYELEASVAMGELVVTVPDGFTVDLRAEAGTGLVEAFGVEDDGVSAEIDRTFEGTEGRMVLELEVGVGHVEVRHG